jgi:hypothetical protein
MKRNNMMILNFLCFLIYFNIINAQNAAPAQAAHAQPVHVHATHAQSTKRPPILSKPKEEIVVRQNRVLPSKSSSGVWITNSGVFHVDIECKLFVCNENDFCGVVQRISLAENTTANCYEEFLPIDVVSKSHVAVGYLNPSSTFIEASNKITNTCRKFRM